MKWKKVRDIVSGKFSLRCYEVFHNEEIAELSKKDTVTIDDLKGLKTFDEAKIAKMGALLIDEFNQGNLQQ